MNADWQFPEIAIVGTGPAGQFLAGQLATMGISVTMLEEGSWPLRHKHRSDHAGSIRLDSQQSPIRHQVAIGYGGTSRLWGVRIANGVRGIRMAAPAAEDLIRPGRAPEFNWPIPHRELQPYVNAALHQMQPDVSPEPGTDPFEGPDLGPFTMAGSTSRYYYFGSVEPFQKPDRLAQHPYVQIRYGIRVASVSGTDFPVLRCLDRESGTELEVRPRLAVLACGGLESVRVLLSSSGIAEQSPALGRYYMDRARYCGERLLSGDTDLTPLLTHMRMQKPTWRMSHLQVDPGGPGSRVSLTPFPIDLTGRNRQRVQQTMLMLDSCGQQLPGRLAMMGTASDAMRRLNLRILDTLAHAAGNFANTSWDYVSRPASRRPGALQLRGTIEHLPDEQNRIVLGPDTDAFGLPALIVDAAFRNGELDQARSVSARYSAHLSDLGLRQDNSFEWHVESYGSHHHMGGARMGSDPSTSVVDANLAVHGHPGVFVLSSAVFPSSSYVNPTLTTQALALRLADHLGGVAWNSPRKPESGFVGVRQLTG